MLNVAYKLLKLTVVLLGGRETPLVLQTELGGPVEEGIHLRHSVQTGQGLERARETSRQIMVRSKQSGILR